MVKCLPTMQKTWVQSLGWEDPLEKEMATYSSTPAWKIPWLEEPGRLQSMGWLRTEQLHFHFSLACIGEGNGNPLQCSCLENRRDGGAQWAAIYGVAQSRTRLERLSSSSSSSTIPSCARTAAYLPAHLLKDFFVLSHHYTCVCVCVCVCVRTLSCLVVSDSS